MAVTPITTPAQALDFLSQAVQMRGRDFVYTKRLLPDSDQPVCRYAWSGQPDCLIGLTLSLAGWTPDMLERLDQYEPNVFSGLSIGWIKEIEDFIPLIHLLAAKTLAIAQNAQDTGETWGEALDQASEFSEFVANLPRFMGSLGS
jgi:hypothetical protein